MMGLFGGGGGFMGIISMASNFFPALKGAQLLPTLLQLAKNPSRLGQMLTNPQQLLGFATSVGLGNNLGGAKALLEAFGKANLGNGNFDPTQVATHLTNALGGPK
jgi:hypothetical protein